MTPAKSMEKRNPSVGTVPLLGGIIFFELKLPKIRTTGMMTTNLPTSIASPSSTFRVGVLALKPPKAEPLFPAVDANA